MVFSRLPHAASELATLANQGDPTAQLALVDLAEGEGWHVLANALGLSSRFAGVEFPFDGGPATPPGFFCYCMDGKIGVRLPSGRLAELASRFPGTMGLLGHLEVVGISEIPRAPVMLPALRGSPPFRGNLILRGPGRVPWTLLREAMPLITGIQVTGGHLNLRQCMLSWPSTTFPGLRTFSATDSISMSHWGSSILEIPMLSRVEKVAISCLRSQEYAGDALDRGALPRLTEFTCRGSGLHPRHLAGMASMAAGLLRFVDVSWLLDTGNALEWMRGLAACRIQGLGLGVHTPGENQAWADAFVSSGAGMHLRHLALAFDRIDRSMAECALVALQNGKLETLGLSDDTRIAYPWARNLLDHLPGNLVNLSAHAWQRGFHEELLDRLGSVDGRLSNLSISGLPPSREAMARFLDSRCGQSLEVLSVTTDARRWGVPHDPLLGCPRPPVLVVLNGAPVRMS